MITCEHICDLLPLWVGDDVTAEEARTISAHLHECRACTAEASAWRDDWSRSVAVLSAEAPPPVPIHRIEDAIAAVATTPRARPRSAVLQPLAAAAVILAMVWWHPFDKVADPSAGLAWSEVQDVFSGCLDDPTPVAEWSAPDGAGVVAVLKMSPSGSGFELADCLEGDDLSVWTRYPWLQQRMRALMDSGDEVMVAVCPDPADDRTERRRLRRTALAELR